MHATKTLVLVRHGTTGPEFHDRYIGSTDIPLAPAGRGQIEDLIPFVSAINPVRCLCSPLKRAQDSAKILTKGLGLSVETEADLREVDFGRWEGKCFSEIKALDPDLVEIWASQGTTEFAFPEGESLGSFKARVRRAADRIAADSTERVLVVTHGGVIRMMICYLLGLPEDRYMAFETRPASVTVVELFEGKGILVGLSNPPQPEQS